LVKIHFIPNPAMTNERRFNHVSASRRDGSLSARDIYLVARQWATLAWYLGYCLLLTVRLVFRIVLWMVRALTPVPVAMGPSKWQRRAPTGLAVPTFDVLVIVFGTAALIGYVWQ
jgi:hypothetical protein